MVNLLFRVWFVDSLHDQVTICPKAQMCMMVMMYVHKNHSSKFDGANIGSQMRFVNY